MGKYDSLFDESPNTAAKSKYSGLFDEDKPQEKSIGQKISEFIAPSASKIPVRDLKSGIKANIAVLGDVAEYPRRIMDFATSLGGNTYGTGELREDIKKAIPGDNIVSQNLRSGVDMLTDPTTFVAPELVAKNAFKTPAQQFAKDAVKRGLTTVEKQLPEKALIKTKSVDGIDLEPSAAQPKTLKEKLPIIGSRIDEGDRSILSEPLSPKDTPFDEYAKIAKAAVENPRNPTPMDIAGIKGTSALDEISKLRKEVGAAKSELLKPVANKIVDVSDIKSKWAKLLEERFGATIVDGDIVEAAGRKIKNPSELPIVRKINETIESLGPNATVQQIDDVKSAIRDAYVAPKATQVKQLKTVVEGIADNIAGTLDDKLVEVAGEAFKKNNLEYRNLKDIEKFLNGKFGEVVDPVTGQARMGASVMKSAAQSNSDRGTKAMFERVRQLTGIDLVKEAKFAEMAMKAAGDQRSLNLLEEIGVASGALPSTTGGLIRMVGAAADKIRGSRLDEMKDFYLKQQKGVARRKPSLMEQSDALKLPVEDKPPDIPFTPMTLRKPTDGGNISTIYPRR